MRRSPLPYPRGEDVEAFTLQVRPPSGRSKAIKMHLQVKKLLADKATMLGSRLTMVRTADIMGFPVQG
ncbi:hypothetical protein GCM10007890_66270 [Methylobacterium tardum]|uniref:Uncharacterized protein n=1 Tax=Methylobacterium tardum TaxID=374432 RepID=A0AA37TIK5_9HYPH|nr:hypothetical protein GCM10007890_66270 [Methylobacterium tardum]